MADLADFREVDNEFGAPCHLVGRVFDTQHTHGSGDTLAAAITAALARGYDMAGAVALGKRFITGAVEGSFPLGSGLGPVGHFWRVREWPPESDGAGLEGSTR